jgi:hypothetical protein
MMVFCVAKLPAGDSESGEQLPLRSLGRDSGGTKPSFVS